MSSILPRLAGKFSEPLAERCGGGPAPGAASPRSGRFKGERLEALWASKSPKATATAKSKILTPRLLGGVEGFKGEDTELPLIPPHFAAHSGQVCFPLKKKINFHPFSKGKKFFPRGSTFYGGARGRFPFFRPRRLIRRGYGAQIYDFSAPSRADALPQSAPPRPLQINRPRQTFVCRGYGLAEPFGLSSALVEPFGSPLPPLPPPAVLG